MCDQCREQPVTHHICYGNTGQTRDLCNGCFEAFAPPELRQFAAAAREAHCAYCGGQPCVWGTDFLATVSGTQPTKFMCVPCTEEYYRYVQQKLGRLAADASQEEQLTALRRLQTEADGHLRRWVSERGS